MSRIIVSSASARAFVAAFFAQSNARDTMVRTFFAEGIEQGAGVVVTVQEFQRAFSKQVLATARKLNRGSITRTLTSRISEAARLYRLLTQGNAQVLKLYRRELSVSAVLEKLASKGSKTVRKQSVPTFVAQVKRALSRTGMRKHERYAVLAMLAKLVRSQRTAR